MGRFYVNLGGAEERAVRSKSKKHIQRSIDYQLAKNGKSSNLGDLQYTWRKRKYCRRELENVEIQTVSEHFKSLENGLK